MSRSSLRNQNRCCTNLFDPRLFFRRNWRTFEEKKYFLKTFTLPQYVCNNMDSEMQKQGSCSQSVYEDDLTERMCNICTANTLLLYLLDCLTTCMWNKDLPSHIGLFLFLFFLYKQQGPRLPALSPRKKPLTRHLGYFFTHCKPADFTRWVWSSAVTAKGLHRTLVSPDTVLQCFSGLLEHPHRRSGC